MAAKKTKYQEFKEGLKQFIYRDNNPISNTLAFVEKYTKVDRGYLAVGIASFLVLFLTVGWGAAIVVNVVGFIYPAYASCKAIDSEEKDDDTQWLTYWVVFAFFSVVESITDLLMFWVPFYFLFKCAFLVWCFLPMKNNGSTVVYSTLIKPFIKKNEGFISEVTSVAKEAARDVGGTAVGLVKSAASKVDAQTILEAKAKLDETASAVENEFSKKDD